MKYVYGYMCLQGTRIKLFFFLTKKKHIYDWIICSCKWFHNTNLELSLWATGYGLEMFLFHLEIFLFVVTRATVMRWDLTCVFVHKTIQ